MSFQMLRPSEDFATILDLASIRPPGDTRSQQCLLGSRHLPTSGFLREVRHGYRSGTSFERRRGRSSGVMHVSRQDGMYGFVVDPAGCLYVGGYGKRDRS